MRSPKPYYYYRDGTNTYHWETRCHANHYANDKPKWHRSMGLPSGKMDQCNHCRKIEKMIEKINIENYKGIRTADIGGFGKINIIVGENNYCKTSLLEAIYLKQQADVFMKHEEHDERPPCMVYILRRMIDLEILKDSSRSSSVFVENYYEEGGVSNLLTAITYNNNLGSRIKISDNIDLSTGSIFEHTSERDTIREIMILTDDFDSKGISRRRRRSKVTNINNFLTTSIDRNHNLLALCSRIKIKNEEQYLLEVLTKIDDRILDIQPLPNSIYLKYKGLDNLVSIETMGDGLVRVLEVITKMYYSEKEQESAFFIDEIENGLYYRTQKVLIRAILESSRAFGIQVFVTTHSYEMIKHFRDVLEEETFSDLQDETKVISLSKGADDEKHNDELKGYSFDFAAFDNAIDTHSEIR